MSIARKSWGAKTWMPGRVAKKSRPAPNTGVVQVKDLRTGVETSNPGAVLDGDLDRFLAASLAARIQGSDEAASAGGERAE